MKSMSVVCVAIVTIVLFAQTAIAEQCYVVVDKSGNYNPTIVESLSVSLISKYIRKVSAVPLAGIKEKDCSFFVNLTESMSGFQFSLSSKTVNSLGTSRKPGMNGVTQSLLRTISRSSDEKQLKKRICNDYPDLMREDCKPIEAVAILYNEQGMIIPNGKSVREGDTFFVMLQPMADAYAVVFNKDSRGQFFRIFPNPQISAQANPLRAHQQYFFPPKDSDLILRFDENPGTETFYFVISSTPLEDLDEVYRSIGSTGSNNGYSTLENRILTRGISIEKKKVSINSGYQNVPAYSKMLAGTGVIVKKVQLNHLR